jgi:SRP40, C-terminal domain
MAESAPAKVKIPPKPQPQQKKKKKSAPDKPQPAWLFPPDEENPVLHPKHKTNEDTIKETQERDKALSYMKRRVHSVPDRPAPPPELLTLVGIFLSDFGFNSTSRLFTNERKARQELNGWKDAIGKKIEKGTPTLETIYRDWYREWKIKQKDETSSSGSSSGTSSEFDSDVELSTKQAINSSSDDDSEASSDGLGGSDVEMKEAPKAKKGKAKNKRIPASSSATTSSESDADDEDEKVKPLSTASKKAESTAKQGATKPTVDAMINSLKRKAASSSSDSSESSLSSDDEELPQAKKPKTTSKSTTTAAALPASPKKFDTKSSEEESSSSSSDSSSVSDSEGSLPPENSTLKASESHARKPTVKAAPVSDSSESASASASNSDSDYDAPAHVPSAKSAVLAKTSGQPPALVHAPSSDSSATINGDSKKPSASISAASEASSATSSESSDSNSESPSKSSPKKSVAEKTKKKHEGAKPTPLAALSASVTEDSYISNKYQNYDYAERAYKDLSVTRGKGFTKEKNKKKRGSYRGGAIDTSGGKSFKFED